MNRSKKLVKMIESLNHSSKCKQMKEGVRLLEVQRILSELVWAEVEVYPDVDGKTLDIHAGPNHLLDYELPVDASDKEVRELAKRINNDLEAEGLMPDNQEWE